MYILKDNFGRKEILYGNGQVYQVKQGIPTPECEANDTECYGG